MSAETAKPPARRRERLFSAYSRWVSRWPKLLAAVCILTAAAALPLAISRFRITADQDSLLSDEVPYHKRYLDYLNDFGDQEYVYVAIANPALVENPAASKDERLAGIQRLKPIADSLAARMRARPDLFVHVDHRVDISSFERNAFLYLPESDVRKIADSLKEMRPILQSLAGDPQPAAIVRAIQGELAKLSEKGQPSAADEQRGEELLRFLERLLAELRQAASGRETKPEAFVALFPTSELDKSEDDPEGYFVSESRELIFILIMPVKDYTGDMAVITKPLTELRRLTEEFKKKHPGLDIGITGRPVLQADEMWTTDADSQRAGILSFVGVALITFAIFGNFGRPVLVLVTLAVGLSWAFLAGTYLVDSFNLLSLIFAAVLVGLGIDFGVHFLVRYQEGLVETRDPVVAIERALVTSAIGNITGAVSTAFGFYGTLLTDFSGLGELGLIAGTGVLLCLASSLLLLPSLLLIYDNGPQGPRPVKAIRHVPLRLNRPWLFLGLALAFSVASVAGLSQVRYDSNLLELQAVGLESVQWEHRILESSKRSSWYSVAMAKDLHEAAEIAERLRKLRTIGRVESPSDFVPEGQVERIALVRQLFDKSEIPEVGLPKPVQRPALADAAYALRDELDALRDLVGTAESLSPEERAEGVRTLYRLAESADSLGMAAESQASTEALDAYARAFRDSLQSKLGSLARATEPTPVSLETLPSPLDTRYRGKSGRYGVIFYPDIDVWTPESLAVHVREIHEVDRLAVGVTIQIHESTVLIKDAFLEAMFYSVLAVVALLILDLKSIVKTLLALIPLAVGIFWMLCWMGLLGYDFNLANFFAVPILVGIGVDGGVHLIHRYGESGELDLTRSSTGTSVVAAALTTMLGFGTLISASHRGLSSMGAILAIGTTTCMLAALCVLPAALQIVYGRRKTQAEAP